MLLKLEKWFFRILVFLILAFVITVHFYNLHHARIVFFAKPVRNPVNKQAHLIAQIQNKPVITMLSVDGGGMAGIIPLQVLAYLEKKTGKPVSELFNVVAGTSTGAIIAASLTQPNAEGKPLNSAQSASDAYQKLGRDLFVSSFWYKLFTVKGIYGPFYDIERVDKGISKYVGAHATLNNSLALVVIYTYCLTNMQLEAIKSWDIHSFFYDFGLNSLIMTSIAAPVYFLPVALAKNKQTPPNVFIDPGVVANNPALQSLRQISDDFPNKKYIILSLGTGLSHLNIVSRKNRFGFHGLLFWARNVPEVTIEGGANRTDSYLKNLESSKNSPISYYLRITPDIHYPPGCSFDSVDDFCINAFKQIGQQAVQQNKKQLDQLAALLMATH